MIVWITVEGQNNKIIFFYVMVEHFFVTFKVVGLSVLN